MLSEICVTTIAVFSRRKFIFFPNSSMNGRSATKEDMCIFSVLYLSNFSALRRKMSIHQRGSLSYHVRAILICSHPMLSIDRDMLQHHKRRRC